MTRPLERRPGFYPQPNNWTCGPFALKHALVALGHGVDAKDIQLTAKSTWGAGTDEIQLARAARSFDCDLMLERRRDPDEARKLLVKYLREQTPVLLCVDQWSHWITVVRHADRRFVVIDSELDPVLNILTWPQLRNRWRYHDKAYDATNPPVLYDLMAVQPRSRTTVKADFSVDRVKFLRRPENHALALHWDEYLEDLLEVCTPQSTRITEALSMGEFLRRHQELLVSRVVYWHGEIEREAILRILRNLRFVSETYDLVIPASATRRAVADLAILLTLWVVASRGVDEMYGDGPSVSVPTKPARGTRKPTRARTSRRAVVRRAAARASKVTRRRAR
ncbi:MAG: hypothetical protein H6708_13445 [Kofleriaceae bacterium]|nr:hypothetical protein [Kofleriaceae bacterium]